MFEVLLALDFLDSVGELYFVVQIMAFTYMIYFLYMTFRDAQLLFGLSSLAAGYFIFVHGISSVFLASFFVFVVIFGMSIQQAVQFGLLPLLGYHQEGDRFVNTKEMQKQQQEAQQMEQVEKRAQAGEASEEEIGWLSQQMAKQQMGQSLGGGQNFMQQQRLR